MVSIDARLELFKKQFPKEKIISFQEREGQDHSILEINHKWMCKSSKTEKGVILLEREVKVLDLLHGKITTEIPMPLYYEHNFLVYKKISGSPLLGYTFQRLGAKQKSKLVQDVAQFIWQLHTALTPIEIESLYLKPSDWPWSVEKLQASRHYLEDNKDLLDVFDNIMKVHAEDVKESFQPTLIHNDLSFNNIIVDPLTFQLKGIIDFADIAFDDPALDLRIRKDSLSNFVVPVVLAYDRISNASINMQKLYGYYFATEFSRYFDCLEHNNAQMAQETLHGIIASIRDFLASHDSCKDGAEGCEHTAESSPVQIQI